MIHRRIGLTLLACLAGAVPLLSGCRPYEAAAGETPAQGATGEMRYEVERKRDITYYDGAEADKHKHQLDLYLPRDKKDFPVVVFVHGGAWVFGDRNFFGVYEAIGRMFARHGVGAAVISYRLSPGVQHPEHIKDVARAFAWVHKHIADYGGRPDQLFVSGHSAGGHLAALLATDESCLKAEGLSLKDVKGAMPISGVYEIPEGMFKEVFGTDRETRRNAGPVHQAHAGCPPFLILYGDKDYPFCDLASENFCKALRAKKVPAETVKIRDRDHLSVIANTAKDDDPCAKAMLDFIAEHVKE